MNSKNRRAVSTPLRIHYILCFLVLLLFYIYSLKYRREAMENATPGTAAGMFRFLPLMVVPPMLAVCFHHTITPKHLIIRFLGIPVRFVPWKDVTGAIYIHSWDFSESNHKTGNCIVVSFVGCPRFDPMHCKMMNYRLENPFGFSLLRFSDKEKDLIISAVQENFPELAFQK